MNCPRPVTRAGADWRAALAPGMVLLLSVAVLVATLASYLPFLSVPLRSLAARRSFSSALVERSCLERLMRSSLPRAAIVYFGPQSSGAAQELIELGYGWVHSVPSATDADWIVGLEPGRRDESCVGVGLSFRHRP